MTTETAATVTKTSGCSPKAVVIQDESDVLTTQQTVLQSAIAGAKTRAEVAALYSMIPPLRSSSALKAVYGVPSISDPFSSAVRPCESDIESA